MDAVTGAVIAVNVTGVLHPGTTLAAPRFKNRSGAPDGINDDPSAGGSTPLREPPAASLIKPIGTPGPVLEAFVLAVQRTALCTAPKITASPAAEFACGVAEVKTSIVPT